MENKALENLRIRLRAPEPEDLDVLFRMENDATLWPVSCNVEPYSRYQLKKYIEESVHDVYTDRQMRFMIELKGAVNAVGSIDLTSIDFLNSRAEVGIALLQEYRGQHIAQEALELLCRHASGALRLKQLYAYVPEDNQESIGLFKNGGFKRSGILKGWLADDGQFRDVGIWQKIFD